MIFGILSIAATSHLLRAQISQPLPATTLVDPLGPGWTHTIVLTGEQKSAIRAVITKYSEQAEQVALNRQAAHAPVARAQFARLKTLRERYPELSPQVREAVKAAQDTMTAVRAPYDAELARLATQERKAIAAILPPAWRQEYLWYAEVGDSLPYEIRYIKLTEAQRTAIAPILKRFLAQMHANRAQEEARLMTDTLTLSPAESHKQWRQLLGQSYQLRTRTYGEYRAVLTPTQRRAYDKKVRDWLLSHVPDISQLDDFDLTIPGIKPYTCAEAQVVAGYQPGYRYPGCKDR